MQVLGRILSNPYVPGMLQMWKRWTGMQRRACFFEVWTLVEMEERDTKTTLQGIHCKSVGAFTSIRCFQRTISLPNTIALQVPNKRVLQGGFRFSVWEWVRRSTLRSLQFRVLSTITDMQKMSFKGVDCGSTINHRGGFDDNHCSCGLDG